MYEALGKRLPRSPSICEIGPGTGLATEALMGFEPARFVAFEPDRALADMIRTLGPPRRESLLNEIERIAEREFAGRVPSVVLTSAFFARSE